MFGKVMHGRLFPKANHFVYRIYYLALPLKQLDNLPIATNRFSPLSFYNKDHGARDGGNLEAWVHSILDQYDCKDAKANITLICMPRIFGYVFNPVSFWLCRDDKGSLRAVLCEVNNTFGETHSYLCRHEDHRMIKAGDRLKAEKLFHVSPMLERKGHYTFRFDSNDQDFKTSIDFYDASGAKQLVTSLTGTFKAMDRSSLRHAFWMYPLITFKAIILIHWQAIKLLSKGIKYISRPAQKTDRLSATNETVN